MTSVLLVPECQDLLDAFESLALNSSYLTFLLGSKLVFSSVSSASNSSSNPLLFCQLG